MPSYLILRQNKIRAKEKKKEKKEGTPWHLAQLAFPPTHLALSLAQPTRGIVIFYPAPEQAAPAVASMPSPPGHLLLPVAPLLLPETPGASPATSLPSR